MSVESLLISTATDRCQKPKILIVESNQHVSAIADLLLNRSGYQTHTIYNGELALCYIVQYEPVNLVLIDVDLPAINGYVVVKKMRSDSRWKNVPVVFLSSKATEKEIVDCFDLGASDYILKPFLPAEFVARIKRLIQMST